MLEPTHLTFLLYSTGLLFKPLLVAQADLLAQEDLEQKGTKIAKEQVFDREAGPRCRPFRKTKV